MQYLEDLWGYKTLELLILFPSGLLRRVPTLYHDLKTMTSTNYLAISSLTLSWGQLRLLFHSSNLYSMLIHQHFRNTSILKIYTIWNITSIWKNRRKLNSTFKYQITIFLLLWNDVNVFMSNQQRLRNDYDITIVEDIKLKIIVPLMYCKTRISVAIRMYSSNRVHCTYK